MPARAAFFDVDKTLVRVNTGRLYMRWRRRRGEVGLRQTARFGRWLLWYSLGVLDAEDVTRKALESLEGFDEGIFREQLRSWYVEWVRPLVAEAGRAEVARRRAEGLVPVILSASTPYAIGPLAEELGIEHVLCSHLEVRDGRFTGRCSELCYGPAKLEIARRWAADTGVSLQASAFYTDSVSDRAMLEAVAEPRVVNPDLRLARLARRRGWPVAQWR
ncbi:MAG: HAD-IB family hydrolase [Myxococcota bacterium]